jgi:hypothetical protein
MNNELERIWKEENVTYSRYQVGTCLEVLRKTTFKTVSGPADLRTQHLANTSLEGFPKCYPHGLSSKQKQQ